jgi:hypothetical protein
MFTRLLQLCTGLALALESAQGWGSAQDWPWPAWGDITIITTDLDITTTTTDLDITTITTNGREVGSDEEVHGR